MHEAFFKFAHALGNMLAPTAAPGLEEAPAICSEIQGLFRSFQWHKEVDKGAVCSLRAVVVCACSVPLASQKISFIIPFVRLNSFLSEDLQHLLLPQKTTTKTPQKPKKPQILGEGRKFCLLSCLCSWLKARRNTMLAGSCAPCVGWALWPCL